MGDKPKYKHIISWLEKAIYDKRYSLGDKVPSLNEMIKQFDVSRDTAIYAYRELMAKGIISSSPGKGYYINSTNIRYEKRIFLLFDHFTPYKEILYNSMKEEVSSKAIIDLYFHHYNDRVFTSLLDENKEKFTDFVVMPILKKSIYDFLDELPVRNNLYILDIGKKELGNNYPSVCQDFEEDIYRCLKKGVTMLNKYEGMVMILPEGNHYSEQKMVREMNSGFLKFCEEYQFKSDIISSAGGSGIRKDYCYLVHYDNDLVELIKHAQKNNYVPGKDIGIISFNETPLKQIIDKGITTISTDFQKMGQTMSKMVLNGKKEHIINQCNLIIRGSI